MRCGACCFLRGICVLRECSIIRAASSSFRLSCDRLVPNKSQAVVSTVQIFFKYLFREITTWDSPPPFPLYTRSHPTDTCPDDHYLIVIADNQLVGAFVAIVNILLAAPVHPRCYGSLAELIAKWCDNALVKSRRMTGNAKSQRSLSLLRIHPRSRRHSEATDVDDSRKYALIDIGGVEYWYLQAKVTTSSANIITLNYYSRFRGAKSTLSNVDHLNRAPTLWFTTFLCKQSSVSLVTFPISRRSRRYRSSPTNVIGIAPRACLTDRSGEGGRSR